MSKNYSVPEFEVVKTDASRQVFFAASGLAPTPAQSVGGSIKSFTNVTGTW